MGLPYHSVVWTKDDRIAIDRSLFGEGYATALMTPHLWESNTIWKPRSIVFEEQSVLGTVSREFDTPTITFQLPIKPFYSHYSLHSQKLVAALRPLVQKPDLIFNPPFVPELNEFYGREIAFHAAKARSQPNSLGIVIGIDDADLTLRALDSVSLIEQLLASRGIIAKTSDAGKVGQRLIRQMDGLQGCRVFKIPGVRELIRAYNPSQSFTRGAAVQTIRGLDPETNVESFAVHRHLHIGSGQGLELKPEDAFRYLLDRKMFHAGLSLHCPHCDLEFWRHLDALATESRCEYCDTPFNLMTQLRDRDWRYRRSGLFGRDDNQAGGIPVALVLQQLDASFRDKIVAWTTGMNLELAGPPPLQCETDFVLIAQHPREGAEIVLSEVKSGGGEITDADVANLARVADRFEDSNVRPFILFAKLGAFTPAEIARCQQAQTPQGRFRVILLSARELEPYILYQRTAEEFEIRGSAIGLDELAQATDSIFLHPQPKAKP